MSKPVASGRSIMFIAGENSGDIHASKVILELKKLCPDTRVFGYGGERMERAGMKLIENLAQNLPIMGFTQVVSKFPKIRALLKQAEELLRTERPDVLVLVDYPGFNLRMAKKARALGIPVAYYISPQFWAWHKSRLNTIRQNVNKMLVILPFEADLYREEGVKAEYVGHPLQDDLEPVKPREEVAKIVGFPADAELIALVPGSRDGEVTRHLPVMLEAADMISKKRPRAHFIMPRALTISPELLKGYLASYPALPLTMVDSEHKSARAAMDFAICKSGTSTLEYALAGVPMIIIYKASAITAFIARRLLQIPHIGLVNIVAQEEIAPELWQEEATGPEIAKHTLSYLESPGKIVEVRQKLDHVREKVGGPGASQRAAQAIAAMLSPT